MKNKKKFNRNCYMPNKFGIYQNTKIKNIPISYLIWIQETFLPAEMGDVLEYVAKELQFRQHNSYIKET